MPTCLEKSCSFGLPRVFFVNYCQLFYLVVLLLVFRAGYVIWLYQFLIIAYRFTFQVLTSVMDVAFLYMFYIILICVEVIYISFRV